MTRTFTVTVNAGNQAPTLNVLGNLTLSQNSGSQTVNLSGISSGAANESQTLIVTAVSSNPDLIPTPTVSYASPNTTGTLTFAPVSFATGTATITVTVNDGQAQNNTIIRTFTVSVANQPPTLNAPADLAVMTNSGLHTINLSGISSGAANEIQYLTVTAVSSNPALIPSPTVSYANANTFGTVTFVPAINATGTATISVTVNDGQAQNNTVTRTFTVTVTDVNQLPTLDAPANLAINANAGLQTVNLTGISSGAANESQTLTVTAVSSNPALISNPTVNYASANTTGTLTFTPVKNAAGTVTITVKVNDGQTQNNTITRTFTVTVKAPNTPPTLNAPANLAIDASSGLQTVNLSGISAGAAGEIQTLTVTAVSSNPALIPNPTVNYASANATGTLTFTPVNSATGTATISVTVNDGQVQSNTVTRTFTRYGQCRGPDANAESDQRFLHHKKCPCSNSDIDRHQSRNNDCRCQRGQQITSTQTNPSNEHQNPRRIWQHQAADESDHPLFPGIIFRRPDFQAGEKRHRNNHHYRHGEQRCKSQQHRENHLQGDDSCHRCRLAGEVDAGSSCQRAIRVCHCGGVGRKIYCPSLDQPDQLGSGSNQYGPFHLHGYQGGTIQAAVLPFGLGSLTAPDV